MYRFFQRNQKKLLAVFGAFLMVVFILPSTAGRGRRTDPVVGYVGSDKIRMTELAQARADWELLKRIPFTTAQFQRVPWVQFKLGRVASEIEETPELFLLLQKEAERMGIRPSPERVENLLHSELEGSPTADQEDQDRRRQAAEAFVTVQSLYDRVGDNVKVTQPMVDHHLAGAAQELKVNLVEFSADDFKSATTAPTTQDVQEQFRKYANVAARQPTTAPASLSFGYQYPNRVKLQYLVVKKDQVRDAVKKSKSDYDWEVAAQRYYQSHLTEFPATQSTNPLLSAALPRTQPTTQPFGYVKDRVMERVMQPEVDRLTADIRSAIAKRLSTGWEQHRAATGGAGATSRPAGAAATAPATSPSPSPATSQPSGFASFAFLEQVAADVQKQFGVLPAVTSKSDQWLTADDLAKLPGIGVSHTTRGDGRNFANYVLTSAEAFFPVPAKADPAQVLSVLEPSEPLEDFDGNVYFVRLTDAQAAHAPTDLADVRQQVETDVVNGRAYAKAVDEAKKLADAAKKDKLETAAAAAGRVVKTTGDFGRGRGGLGATTVPNYPLDADARAAFVAQAYEKLLGLATPDRPHPVAVIELPSERKVVVAELAGVKSQMKEAGAFADRLITARQIEFTQERDLAADFLRADAVKSRLNYRSADPEEDKRREEEKRKRNGQQAASN
jgi:hypothetical protein